MKKYTFILFFSIVFTFSCADTNSIYDYNSEESTLGLSVLPSNVLVFTSEYIEKEKNFDLSIDTNIITLINIDNASSDYGNFELLSFDKGDCLTNIAIGKKCILSIKMKNNATINDSGYVKLQFIYNNDSEAEPGIFKYHRLSFIYQDTNP